MAEGRKKQMMMMRRPELPFGLVASEILSRVPCKSDIGRCRCVCKEWRSHLSTHTFNRWHLRNHVTVNDYKLVIFDGQPPVPFRTLPLNNDVVSTTNPNPNPGPTPAAVSVIATLHGLVLLASKEAASPLVLWNPLTGAYRKLSTIPRYCVDTRRILPSLRLATGFYIDNESNDYRLLCLLYSGRAFAGARVYSHRLDSWIEVECSVLRLLLPDDKFGVWSPTPTLFRHCLYFTVTYMTQVLRPNTNDLDLAQSSLCCWIICFDVGTEAFRKIPPPPLPDGGVREYSGISLVVLDGRLHLCATYIVFFDRNCGVKHADLWRMDGDQWVKVAAFSDPGQRQRICTASTGSWLAILDQDENSFKKMSAEDFTSHYHYFSSPSRDYMSNRIIYVESLVSPNP